MSRIVRIGNISASRIDVTRLFTPENLQAAENAFRSRRLQEYARISEQYSQNQERIFREQLAAKQRQIDTVRNSVSGVRSTANSALTKAQTVDRRVTQGLTDVVRRGEFRQTINANTKSDDQAQTTARNAATQASLSSVAATAAGNIANTAKGLITNFLNLLGPIGGAAGLLSLFGFFVATRPTLEAHGSRLDSQERALSRNLTLIGANRSIANRADKNSEQALQQSQQAQKQAEQAIRLAEHADRNSNQAIETARQASQRAATAIDQANQSQQGAREAIEASRANAAEIDQLRREQTTLNSQQYNQLQQQNQNAIGQNDYLIGLVTELQTSVREAPVIPPELLAVPAVLTGVRRDTSAIARNTTASAQQQNARAAVCESFRGGGCGDASIRRNLNPVMKELKKLFDFLNSLNAFLIEQVGRKLDTLIQTTLKFRNKTYEKFAQTWSFLGVDRVLNLVNTAASLHNAAMLSRNALGSLTAAIDGILSLLPIKDPEGRSYSFSDWISSGVQGIINATIGQEAAQGISDRWNRWNRIISSGAAVVMAVRSVQWAIAEGIEIIGGWIAKMGNGLREEGAVSDRAWPWMKEGLEIKQFSKLDRFNNGVESAENIANEIYGTVAAGAEIVEAVNGVRAAKQQFESELETQETEANDELAQRNTASESADINPVDLVRIEEVE